MKIIRIDSPVPKLVSDYDAGTSPKNKNIVINFDGTDGAPAWANQEEQLKDIYYQKVGGLSNIGKIHLYAGGNIGNSRSAFGAEQISLYYSGVGTRGNIGCFKGLRAVGSFGSMIYLYKMAYEDLEAIYEEGDQLYVFGFSRGAATARLFVSYLSKNPLKKTIVPQVAFLGVFDTVVSSFVIGRTTDPAILDIDSKKDRSLPPIVKKALHLVSIDDLRFQFQPTLFPEDPKVTEIWCPGIHSDIGGGYYHDGLSDITLNVMLMAAKESGMKCREITEDICVNNTDCSLYDPSVVPELNENRLFNSHDKDFKITPNALEPDIHDEMVGVKGVFFNLSNFLKGFKFRLLKKFNKNHEEVVTEPILLLDAAVERVKNWNVEVPLTFKLPPFSYVKNRYRPQALKGIRYKVVNSGDLSISDEVFEGIEKQVKWDEDL